MIPLLAATLVLAAPARWRSPLVPVWTPRDYARFADRLGDEGVFVRGDRLTFLARGKANPFALPFWLTVPFVRDAARGLWVGQARGPDAEKAFFGYALRTGGARRGAWFYGPRALRPPKAAKPLRGRFETVSFPSRHLGMSRSIAVYLPPRPAKGTARVLNAVYMADGQSCETFAKVLEPLILAGRVAPTAIVGIYHGPYQGDPKNFDFHKDLRAREYLKVIDAERFAAHLRFVAEELIPWAERTYGLASGASHRALLGFSNGGAFVVDAAAERPGAFGTLLPFSIAVFDRERLAQTLRRGPFPRVFLAAGDFESFVVPTERAADVLRSGRAKVRFRKYASGHDEAMWRRAFADAMPRVFPRSQKDTQAGRSPSDGSEKTTRGAAAFSNEDRKEN